MSQIVGSLAHAFDMTGATARYVRIVGSPVQQLNGLLNIGEVAFEGVAASVPGPDAFMLVVAALLGLVRQNRKLKS